MASKCSSLLITYSGASVFATTRNAEADAGARLAIVGVADAVTLHRFDAATATPDAMAKLLDTLQPDQIYHLATSPDVTPWLQTIRDRAPAVRLFAAVSAATPEAADTVRHYRESDGVFAVTGLLGAHESRLAPLGALLRHIVEAAHACKHGDGAKLRIGALETPCDIGWAPEYVDAMTKMLLAAEAADCAIATGRPIRLQDFVAQAFDNYGLDWQAHVDIDPAFRVPAVAAVIGDPAPAQAQLRWHADTFGKDLVETLCEAAGAGAHLA